MKEETNEPSLKYVLGLLVLAVALTVISIPLFGSLAGHYGGGYNSNDCAFSKYNVYSNQTGGIQVLDRCYVQTISTYTSTQDCGLFGLFCWQTEPKVKTNNGGVCFNVNNGKLC